MTGGAAHSTSRRAVVFCADAGYVVPLAVSLRSLARSQHHPDDLEVIVLSAGIPAPDQVILRDAAQPLPLRFADIDALLTDELPVSDIYPVSVWGRLWAVDHLPAVVDRAVYLDADILVCADLGELFTTPISASGIAAVPDVGIPHVANPLGLSNWRTIGLEPTTPYFNTGVLVIDPSRWRAARLTERVLAYATAHPEQLVMPDQECLNAVIAGDFAPLPLRWNQLHRLREPNHLGYSFFDRAVVDAAITDPAIIHFSGTPKPWDAGCVDPARGSWLATLAETGYRDHRPARPSRRSQALRFAGRVARRALRA